MTVGNELDCQQEPNNEKDIYTLEQFKEIYKVQCAWTRALFRRHFACVLPFPRAQWQYHWQRDQQQAMLSLKRWNGDSEIATDT